MPEAGQQPHYSNVAQLLYKAALVAAERDIDIIPEPCSHGYVPAAPEVGNAVGKERVIEILKEAEPKHTPKAYCHIGIAREVKVNLESVSYNAKPCRKHCWRGLCACRLPQQPYVVCKQYLFAYAAYKPLYAGRKQLYRAFSMLQFVCHGLVADDWAGYKLRKQRDVCAEVDYVLLRLCFAAVNVDGIAHGLEGIKADAYRQGQIRLRYSRAEQRIDSAYQKVAILEHTKQTEIDAYRYEQRGLCAALAAVALGKLPACVVKHGGEYHKQHIHRLSPRIEQQAECEQYSVPPCLWRNEIRKQAQRKEALQKRKAGEYHT